MTKNLLERLKELVSAERVNNSGLYRVLSFSGDKLGERYIYETELIELYKKSLPEIIQALERQEKLLTQAKEMWGTCHTSWCVGDNYPYRDCCVCGTKDWLDELETERKE